MAVKTKKKGSENKRPAKLQTDFTGVEGRTGRRRIKEGDYLWKITDYEVGKSDKTDDEGKKKRFLVVKYDTLKGPSKGAFSDLFGLAKNQLWRYRLFLEAVGISVKSGVNEVDLTKLVGKKVAGTVEDDEYNGKIKSQVSDYFPAADFEELSSSEAEDEDEDEDEDVAEASTDDDEDDDEELETVDEDEDEDEEDEDI
jgi:hypothetical protein